MEGNHGDATGRFQVEIDREKDIYIYDVLIPFLFRRDLDIARQSFVNRARRVREVYKGLESGLTLAGATGIEDRLQEK